MLIIRLITKVKNVYLPTGLKFAFSACKVGRVPASCSPSLPSRCGRGSSSASWSSLSECGCGMRDDALPYQYR